MTHCRKFDGCWSAAAFLPDPNGTAMILFACATLICVVGTALIYAGYNNNNFAVALGGIIINIFGLTAYAIFVCKHCMGCREENPIGLDLVPVARVINPVTELPPGTRLVPGIALV